MPSLSGSSLSRPCRCEWLNLFKRPPPHPTRRPSHIKILSLTALQVGIFRFEPATIRHFVAFVAELRGLILIIHDLNYNVIGASLLWMKAKSILSWYFEDAMHPMYANWLLWVRLSHLILVSLPLLALHWQVRSLLSNRNINIRWQILVYLLDYRFEIRVSIFFLYAEEDFWDKEQVWDELWCGQKQRMLDHIVAQSTHHLLVEPYHSCMAFKLIDMAVVVRVRTSSVGLTVICIFSILWDILW